MNINDSSKGLDLRAGGGSGLYHPKGKLQAALLAAGRAGVRGKLLAEL